MRPPGVPFMRKLLLLRHAKAVPAESAPDDFERGLNARGKAAAQAVARHFADTRLQPDLVLCSSSLRTRETLAELLPAMPQDCGIAVENGLYMASAPRLLERLRNAPDNIVCQLLIGHNPGLERLARLLAGSGPEAKMAAMRGKFPTAALAILEFAGENWRAIDKDGCRLVDFVCPRDLED